MIDLVLVLPAFLVALLAISVIGVWHRRRERRRRRDLRFNMLIADAMRRRAMIRPKADSRVQRRRYAR